MRARREPQPVHEPPERHREAEQHARRPQQPSQQAAVVPVTHYFDDCVVKVICERPATRAASMTRITAWCVAVASALITTTGSLAPAPARFSSSASSLMLRNTTGRRLITYWPCAFTSTAISLERSSCLSASAAGRLICSSLYFE